MPRASAKNSLANSLRFRSANVHLLQRAPLVETAGLAQPPKHKWTGRGLVGGVNDPRRHRGTGAGLSYLGPDESRARGLAMSGRRGRSAGAGGAAVVVIHEAIIQLEGVAHIHFVVLPVKGHQTIMAQITSARTMTLLLL